MLMIEVGGLRVALATDARRSFEPMRDRYEPFLVDAPICAELRLAIELEDSPSFEPPDSTLHFRPADATGWRYTIAGVGASGSFDMERGEGYATLDQRLAPFQLEYLLRALYAYLALWEGGLLIHAAGLCYDDRAWLFIGLSGSGKTTVVRLASGARALSDDLVLLRPGQGGWMAHSTPFWSMEELARGQRRNTAPLAGIFRLVKSHDVRTEALPPPVAVAELVANCPVVNADPLRLPGLMAVCGDLVAASPPRNLHFRKDPAFWDLVTAQQRRMSHEP